LFVLKAVKMEVLVRVAILCIFVAGMQCAWVKEMENKGLFQGDIALDPDERMPSWGNGSLKTFASIKGGRWPEGKVPYYIERSIGSQGRRAIAAAIENYHKYTCIRFHPRTNERSYISFFKGGGCFSPIGYRRGRVNRISLGNGCQYTGIAMHEMGHSMGFWHEQMRPDRDDHVKIMWGNIKRGMSSQFDKLTYRTIDSLGTPYDYSSMMHYGSTAFSTGWGRKTIVTKDPNKQRLIGQRHGFSEIDKKQLGLMYNKICTGGGGGGGGGGTVTDPPSVCDNKNARCDEWAKKGECVKNQPWMLANCCKACKDVCGECTNKNPKCDDWAGQGFCHGSHGYWMRCNCCIACKGK